MKILSDPHIPFQAVYSNDSSLPQHVTPPPIHHTKTLSSFYLYIWGLKHCESNLVCFNPEVKSEFKLLLFRQVMTVT